MNTTPLDPVTDGGLWGGLLVLGSAPINWYDGAGSVGETSVEGFPAGSSSDILYGGSDAGDGTDAGPGRRDGAINRPDGGGIMPLYGGPMLPDAGIGRRDAGGDAGGGITPLYGAPPTPGS